MTETKPNKGDGFELNSNRGDSVDPNDKDGSNVLPSGSKLKGINSIKSEQNASTSKSKKKRDSKAKKEQFVDIDEYSLGGIKYKLPGKKQRVLVGSIVLGLNLLLLIAVILYFKVPAFQDFIYHVGRDV